MKYLSGALKSKTMWFALVLAILGAVQASLGLFSTLLTPMIYGVVTLVIGIAVAVLRIVTVLPVEEK